jgi:polysaccharide biosynthesis transport protein
VLTNKHLNTNLKHKNLMDSNIHLDEYIDFQKYWLVLKRRWVPATATLVATLIAGAVYSSFLPVRYEAEGQLLIKKQDRSAKLTGLESEADDITGVTEDSNPLSTEAAILQSRPILESLIQKLDLRNEDGELYTYDQLEGSLEATPLLGTDILEVTYKDEEPQVAAKVVNQAIASYIQDHTLNNRSETTAAREFIARQLPQVEANLKQAEADLRIFQNQNRLADLEQETTANIDSLSEISNQIDESQAELEDINTRYQRLATELNMTWQEASAISSLSDSMAVTTVLEQLQTVKIALAQKRNYLSDSAPQIIALQEEEADLSSLLDRQISATLGSEQQALVQNVNILGLGNLKQEQIAALASLGLQKEGLENKLTTLNNTYNSYKQKADNLPALHQQYRELERKVAAAQSTYQTLLGRLQETQIAEQQNMGNVRVVSQAIVPDEPLGSRKKLILAASGVMGTLLGLTVAFLLDIRDKTLKNTQEIEELLPYILHGIVPDYNKIQSKQLFLPPSDRSIVTLPNLAVTNISAVPIREAYQNIQVNLKLLDSQLTNKVLVITSAILAEGKSSVSANLAITEARCGQRVLLIDGDLRCPNQQNLWEVNNDIGLAEVLKQEVAWQQAIQHVMPNLHVMTSGSSLEHPVSLLNSPQMKEFITNILGYYDRIIFDTPPLVGLADSKILSKLADGVIFVVRPGVTNYGSITAAKKILETTDLNVLGVVANGVNLDAEPYGREYYYPDKKYLAAR